MRSKRLACGGVVLTRGAHALPDSLLEPPVPRHRQPFARVDLRSPSIKQVTGNGCSRSNKLEEDNLPSPRPEGGWGASIRWLGVSYATADYMPVGLATHGSEWLGGEGLPQVLHWKE